jgi:hypothetical protein
MYLPIDARQKKLFDAIDGKRSLGQIAREQAQREPAQKFFEQLWWHDQVVFNASTQEKAA